MKTFRLIPLFCLLFFNCTGQDKKQEETNTFKPDANIQVNKEYDEHGNLIKYDSIYSYSYSSNGKINDSMKTQFQRHFNSHSFFNDTFYDDFFKRDSLTGFYHHRNFFFDGFMNKNEEIKKMMRRMDSIQQMFFKENRESIIPEEPEKSKLNRI
ncbi:MAG: hypothetical protein HKO01_12520 [Flaviramulus sp.]|nr:hypothetical protein [Flaviramulus sp.]NNC51345.1 hypothetical protein [Flaviramulus sp.]